MISKEEALEIGKAYLEGKGIKPDVFELDFKVDDVKDVEISTYTTVPINEGWIIKYPDPNRGGMICSSWAILISKETGEIIYDGSTGDEG